MIRAAAFELDSEPIVPEPEFQLEYTPGSSTTHEQPSGAGTGKPGRPRQLGDNLDRKDPKYIKAPEVKPPRRDPTAPSNMANYHRDYYREKKELGNA